MEWSTEDKLWINASNAFISFFIVASALNLSSDATYMCNSVYASSGLLAFLEKHKSKFIEKPKGILLL